MGKRVIVHTLYKALAIVAGLTALAGCPATGGMSAVGGGNSGTVIADGSGADSGAAGPTPVADNGGPHGGSIDANVGSMDINPCLTKEDCPTDTQLTMPDKKVAQVCTQDYFREVCWAKDFRPDLGLDQKTDEEQFAALSQGQISDKIANQASIRDVCVDHVDVSTLGSYLKFWQTLCVFAKPPTDSTLLGGVESPSASDVTNYLAGSQFLAIVSKKPVEPAGTGGIFQLSNGGTDDGGNTGSAGKIPHPTK